MCRAPSPSATIVTIVTIVTRRLGRFCCFIRLPVLRRTGTSNLIYPVLFAHDLIPVTGLGEQYLLWLHSKQ
jgi:hypothetical protein